MDKTLDADSLQQAGSALRGLREWLERIEWEARGCRHGAPPQTPKCYNLNRSAAGGLRALAELDQFVDRIKSEATQNAESSDAREGGK
jgi:hypothetical protein